MARRNVADSSGGAIYTEHSLALDSVIIDNSIATSGGGVVFGAQYPGQTLTISNSQFLDNIATEVVPATPRSTNSTPVAPCTSQNDARMRWTCRTRRR